MLPASKKLEGKERQIQMFEIIKKDFAAKKRSRHRSEKENALENFGESVANGYEMSILSGIYSVNNL